MLPRIRLLLVAARVVLRVVAALRPIGAQRLGGERAFGGNARAAQRIGRRPDDRAHLQKARVFLEQRQADAAGVGQPLQLLADRLQHPIEVVLLEQQRARAAAGRPFPRVDSAARAYSRALSRLIAA